MRAAGNYGLIHGYPAGAKPCAAWQCSGNCMQSAWPASHHRGRPLMAYGVKHARHPCLMQPVNIPGVPVCNPSCRSFPAQLGWFGNTQCLLLSCPQAATSKGPLSQLTWVEPAAAPADIQYGTAWYCHKHSQLLLDICEIAWSPTPNETARAACSLHAQP